MKRLLRLLRTLAHLLRLMRESDPPGDFLNVPNGKPRRIEF